MAAGLAGALPASAGAAVTDQQAPTISPYQVAPAPPTPGAEVSSATVLPPRAKDPAARTRYLVRTMEGVLERAVQHAAQSMNRRLQTVSPDLVQLSGAARARGFRLDGYGVFFDVEVPAALRQTMGWTVRMMQQNDRNTDQALSTLRQYVNTLSGQQRNDAEIALKWVELRMRPNLSSIRAPFLTTQRRFDTSPRSVESTAVSAASTTSATEVVKADPTNGPALSPAAVTAPSAATAPPSVSADPVFTDLWLTNPDLAYEVEVRDALVDAMLQFGSTLTLQPDEWLTVAARDNESLVMPGDVSETITVILRIKGSDLAGLKAGRLTEADVRQRVEVREF